MLISSQMQMHVRARICADAGAREVTNGCRHNLQICRCALTTKMMKKVSGWCLARRKAIRSEASSSKQAEVAHLAPTPQDQLRESRQGLELRALRGSRMAR